MGFLAAHAIRTRIFPNHRLKSAGGVCPSDGTQLRIYLATPESLQRVKFKVKDIPL